MILNRSTVDRIDDMYNNINNIVNDGLVLSPNKSMGSVDKNLYRNTGSPLTGYTNPNCVLYNGMYIHARVHIKGYGICYNIEQLRDVIASTNRNYSYIIAGPKVNAIIDKLNEEAQKSLKNDLDRFIKKKERQFKDKNIKLLSACDLNSFGLSSEVILAIANLSDSQYGNIQNMFGRLLTSRAFVTKEQIEEAMIMHEANRVLKA